MNSTICANAEMHTTGQLTDLRDGKQYWVTKLKDGNCWMTQNLDFDIPDTLYSTTSNVSSASVTTGTTKATAPSNWPANNDNPNYNGYYDPGDYIYNGPSGSHGQGSYCNTTTGLSECTSKYPEQWTTAGDTHYHIGNYYSFSAATVKSGDDITTNGSQASDSICPKGWQLPISGRDTTNNALAPWNNDKSFAKLFEAYGWTWSQGYYTDTLNGGTSYYIYNAPFYFTYVGALNSSTLFYAGSHGFYWSSTVYSGTYVFALSFYSVVPPANYSYRSDGFSVRCVAE